MQGIQEEAVISPARLVVSGLPGRSWDLRQAEGAADKLQRAVVKRCRSAAHASHVELLRATEDTDVVQTVFTVRLATRTR